MSLNSAKKRLLVVDDDISFTRLLKMNLEQTKQYSLRIENDPARAFPAAVEFQPDLVMLDVMMPGMDGGDVAAKLKSDSRFKNLPIIFLTAAVQKNELGKGGGRIGGFPYLAKPADLPQVMQCIESHLGSGDNKTGI